MTIHREGRFFLIVLAIILVALNVGLYNSVPEYIKWGMLIFSVVIFFFFLQFFRHPTRNLTKAEGSIISPADGKVVVIEEVYEDEYLQDQRLQVSIFMSPTNVHLNRVPLDGIVEYYKYHAGKYLVAFHPKSSKLNERNTAVITNAKGQKVLMRQIAGAVARRIRFYLKPGQEVKQGEELGFIKFGSRMDIFFPLGTEICVTMGQKVTGGVTLIAKLPEA
ncbi:MAG: phosphatidylserine decarboxylase family protein [Sphingobacteriales bacterium]|nr:MAG: phosphatidylserine decarboxylase family protein [Sphingobacteriales bacterium]